MIRQTVTALTQPAACALSIQWLVHPQLMPGARGLIAVEVLRDGETTNLSQLTPAESATLVLAGKCAWTGKADQFLGPGEGVFNPSGTLRGAHNGSEATVLLTVYGGCSGLEKAPVMRIEQPDSDGYGCPIALPADNCLTNFGDGLDTLGGCAGMGIRWLVTTETVGSQDLVLATSTFIVSGSHDLHRHERADEFFLVLSGAGEHVSEYGPTRLTAGDLAFIPAGEWHGFRTDPKIITRTVYGYLGAGSLDQAGYDLYDGGKQ